MNVLVVGSGGREHALVWKISQSRLIGKLYCAPGNPGIGELAQLVNVHAADIHGLVQFAAANTIDLTVVGPEQPLAAGITDEFERQGLAVFGPSRLAAELEWSKAFAKDFMQRHHIPTASHRTFTSGQREAARAYLASCPLPVVLKADGLAAGKGVVVCGTRGEAAETYAEMTERKSFGAAGETVVIEEFLQGIEASVFAVSDGADYLTLAPAQDHKRALDGDRGKNTGGMGAYAPAPMVTEDVLDEVEQTIIAPTLQGMATEGRPYKGCLYVGLMLTQRGPKVVEFNCRFGDPETQVVVPLFDGDFLEILSAAAAGKLGTKSVSRVRVAHGHAACIILASGEYPDAYRTGLELHGLEKAAGLPGVMIFHAGTKLDGHRMVTAGGRVLGVTAVAHERREAIQLAYRAVETITFEGMHFRRDIGRKALEFDAFTKHMKVQ